MRGQSRPAWAWTRQLATRPFAEVAFQSSRTHFVWRKQFLHRLPEIFPCHQILLLPPKWQAKITRYRACPKKWQLYSTRLDSTMVYPTLLYFALLYSALPVLLYAVSTLLYATLLCSSLLCSTLCFKNSVLYIASFSIKLPLIVFYIFYDIISYYMHISYLQWLPSILKP